MNGVARIAALVIAGGIAAAAFQSAGADQEVEELARKLKKGKSSERTGAVYTLGKMGRAGAPALAQGLLESRDQWVGIGALAQMGEAGVVELLQLARRSKEPAGKPGEAARDAGGNTSRVVSSACALRRLGDPARAALPVLEAAAAKYGGLVGTAVKDALEELRGD